MLSTTTTGNLWGSAACGSIFSGLQMLFLFFRRRNSFVGPTVILKKEGKEEKRGGKRCMLADLKAEPDNREVHSLSDGLGLLPNLFLVLCTYITVPTQLIINL